MTAADTNLLVRILTRDHEEQAAAAWRLFNSDQIWIAKTVLLECAWVLRDAYGYDESAVRKTLLKFCGLGNIRLEDRPTVMLALELSEKGLNFADAMHFASRPDGVAFASFDKVFVKRAARAGQTLVFDPAAR